MTHFVVSGILFLLFTHGHVQATASETPSHHQKGKSGRHKPRLQHQHWEETQKRVELTPANWGYKFDAWYEF